jgi:hypothetical protein
MCEKAFLIVGIVNESIFRVGSETGSVTFSKSRVSLYESGSKTRRKWNPDPKKVSDPQHCGKIIIRCIVADPG